MDKGISIVICTWRRAGALKVLLDRICLFAVPQKLTWEVLVIDNADDNDTLMVVEEFINALPIRRIVEKQQGVSFARNKGAVSAKYNVILYIDDDVVPDLSLLQVTSEKFNESSLDMLCPRIVTPIDLNWPTWLRQRIVSGIGQFDLGDESCLVSNEVKPPITACLAMRKDVWLRYGPFPTSLGHSGNKPWGGEESFLFRRALADQINALYEPAVVAQHNFVNKKMTRNYWRKVAFYGGRSYVVTRKLQGCSGFIRLFFWSVNKSIVRFILSIVKSDRSFENHLSAIAHLGRAAEVVFPIVKLEKD